MTARNHHYIPQFYLKGFARSRKKPKLYVFDYETRKAFTTHPANVAVERDFNRIDIEGHPIDAFENLLSTEETLFSAALARIIARRSIADADDREALLRFVAVLCVKTPRMRESVRAFHEQVATTVMGIATETPERWERQTRNAEGAGYKPDQAISYEEMRRFVQQNAIKASLKTEVHLSLEMSMEQTVAPSLAERKWILLKTLPGSPGFITSDHPAVLMWSDPNECDVPYPPGHGLLGTQVVFPISSGLAMLGAFESEDEQMDATEALVAIVNGNTMLHAARQIYAPASDFTFQMSAGGPIRTGIALSSEPWFNRT